MLNFISIVYLEMIEILREDRRSYLYFMVFSIANSEFSINNFVQYKCFILLSITAEEILMHTKLMANAKSNLTDCQKSQSFAYL